MILLRSTEEEYMFLKNMNFEGPPWAYKIILEINNEFLFRLYDFKWKKWEKNRISGRYYYDSHSIEIFSKTFLKTKKSLSLLLHEISHAIYNYNEYKYIKKYHYHSHNRDFYIILYNLYKKYDVLDIALENEYMIGREILQELKDNHCSNC